MIDENILINEVLTTVKSGKGVTYRYSIAFLTDDGEILPLSLLGIDIKRDCYSGWYDGIKAKVLMEAGRFNKLARYKDNLKVRLFKTPTKKEDGSEKNLPTEVRLFRAVLDEKATQFLKGEFTGRDENDLDLTSSLVFGVQLIDLAIDKILHMSVSATLHNMTLLDAYRYLLGLTKDLNLPDEASIHGVDMPTPKDSKVWEDIVVSPISIPKLGSFLKKNYYGMYPVGTLEYFYRNHWFVYPKVNTDGSITSSKNVVIVNVPEDRFEGLHTTYYEDDESMKIICTGGSLFKDTYMSSSMNIGRGIRYIDPEKLEGEFGEYNNGKYTVSLRDNLSEFLIDESKTGNTNASFHESVISSDIENKVGDLYLSGLKQVTVNWDNSDPDKILPGMTGIYVQEDRSGTKSYHCMIAKSEHITNLIGNRVMDEGYHTQSVLVLILGEEVK